MLQTNPRKKAKHLKIDDFKASSGWLEVFISRNNITCRTTHSNFQEFTEESADSILQSILQDTEVSTECDSKSSNDVRKFGGAKHSACA